MKKLSKGNQTFIALATALLTGFGAGCGSGSDVGPLVTAAPPVNVTVTLLSPQTLHLYARLPATVLPWRQVDLAFEEAGVVQQVYHELGDRVHAGTPMARLDTSMLNAAAKEAKAALVFAIYDDERATDLHDEGSLSERDLNGARYQLEQASAASRTLDLRLQRSIIRAPFSGQVAARHVEAGQHVQMGSTVFRLVDSDSVRAVVWVPEAQVGHLAKGRPATLAFDAHPNRVFHGAVGAIGPEADPDRRVFPLEIYLANPFGAMRPGMIAEARILSQRLEQVIAIPRRAVLQRRDSPAVFIVEEGIARLRPVGLGAGENGNVVVISGLAFGDAIVIDGARQLADGDMVAVKKRVVQ